MKNFHAVSLGSLGGKASAKSLTPEQRSERAKKAVTAREAKRNSVHTTNHPPGLRREQKW